MDCFDAGATREFDDPRIDDAYGRYLPASDGLGAVLLLGVVHDHPASTVRVARLLEPLSPDVLALELPPMAVPLFRRYARDDRTPPRLGGEMSAALQAADADRHVGIDAPNRDYISRVGRRLLGGASVGVARRVLRDVASGYAQAVACRLGALFGAATTVTPRLYTPIDHDCSLADDADRQAEHEAAHVSRRRALLGAVEVPPATSLIDDAREDAMAARVDSLRSEGDVVAVVGVEHLDGLHERLAAED